MVDARTSHVAARFALIIATLCYSVLERATNLLPVDLVLEPLPQPLLGAMWDRAARLGQRFARLVACLNAGTLPVARPRPARAEPARSAPVRAVAVDGASPPEPARLPRDFGWFCRLSPHAHGAVAHLRLILSDPDMAALVATHPSFGRVMRPLCHMLAIAPQPDFLALQALPPRPREPRQPRPRPKLTPGQERHADMFSRETAFGPQHSRRPRAKNG